MPTVVPDLQHRGRFREEQVKGRLKRKTKETNSLAVVAGVPAELPPDYRPNLWPDFMGKEPFRSYPGKTVLGEIFRMVSAFGEFWVRTNR